MFTYIPLAGYLEPGPETYPNLGFLENSHGYLMYASLHYCYHFF